MYLFENDSSRSTLLLNISKKSRIKIKSYLSSFSSQHPNLIKNPKRHTLRHSLESQITLVFEVHERSPILYEQVSTSRSRQLEFYSWENIYRSGITCRRGCLFLKNNYYSKKRILERIKQFIIIS